MDHLMGERLYVDVHHRSSTLGTEVVWFWYGGPHNHVGKCTGLNCSVWRAKHTLPRKTPYAEAILPSARRSTTA